MTRIFLYKKITDGDTLLPLMLDIFVMAGTSGIVHFDPMRSMRKFELELEEDYLRITAYSIDLQSLVKSETYLYNEVVNCSLTDKTFKLKIKEYDEMEFVVKNNFEEIDEFCTELCMKIS